MAGPVASRLAPQSSSYSWKVWKSFVRKSAVVQQSLSLAHHHNDVVLLHATVPQDLVGLLQQAEGIGHKSFTSTRREGRQSNRSMTKQDAKAAHMQHISLMPVVAPASRTSNKERPDVP